MQLSFNRSAKVNVRIAAANSAPNLRKLTDLHEGEAAVLDRIDFSGDLAHRLMELGFLPGMQVTAARSAPGGDPRVFQVDGTEIALRKDTAARLVIKS